MVWRITDNRTWNVAIRTNYIRSHSSVTDLNFDPVFPDGDVHVATVGIEFLCHVGGKFLKLISCADGKKSFLAKSSIGLDVFYQADRIPASYSHETIQARSSDWMRAIVQWCGDPSLAAGVCSDAIIGWGKKC